MELPKEEKSALDSIEHQLYDPKKQMDDVMLHRVRDRRALELPTSWGDATPIIKGAEEEKTFSFGAKFLILSGVILIIAVSFTAWRVLSSRNVVSSANIEMSADVPSYAEGGEAISLVVTLQNKNVSTLEESNITLIYKKGTGSQDEQEKINEKRDLGMIKSGEYKRQDFQIVLYGSEAESRDLTVKLEYKVAGSNAVFCNFITTPVVLKAPPISVHVDGPSILSIGQNETYIFTVKNNSATTSVKSVLQITLPNTFTVASTNPKSSSLGTTWQIPPLLSGEEKTVSVVGTLSGTPGETLTMRGIVGSQGSTINSIGVVYASQVFDIKLRSSPLVLNISLDTDRGNSETLRYGDNTTLTINYLNNSDNPLQEVSLKLEVAGDAPTIKQIDPGAGYFDSEKQTILWDKVIVPDFATLMPHKEGVLRVSIPIVLKGINSPALKLVLTGKGTATELDDITYVFTKSWIVQGSANISAQTSYKNSPFQNTGPIPPVVNMDTTYTAHIIVSAQNALINTKVSFVLPTYVTWRGVTSDDKAILYDSKTRTVSWLLGSIPAGKIIAADISLSVRPSQSHFGKSPTITSGIVLDTDEEESKAHIRTTISSLTTNIAKEDWPDNPSRVVEK